MPALEAQRLLARLYTDPEMLAEFLADRDGFCRRHTEGSRDLMMEIDGRRLELFALSLISKRAGEVKKLLPMTARALGHGFRVEFDRYAARMLPGGEKRHAADAMAFCEHLLGEARGLERYAREAATFELLSLRARFKLKREGKRPVVCRAIPTGRPWLRLKRFAYEMPALTGRAEGEGMTGERPTLVAFVNLPGLRGIWYW